MDNQQSFTAAEQNEIVGVRMSAKEMVFKYLSYLPLFLIVLSISLTIAFLTLRYSVNQYATKIYVLVKDDKKNNKSTDMLDLFSMNKYSNLANEIEMVKSITLMEQVVEALNLNVLYLENGKIKTTEVYKQKSYSAEFISIKDSTKGAGFTFQYKQGGKFTIDGDKTNKIYKSGDTLYLYNATARLLFNGSPTLDEQFKYDVFWQPTNKAARSVAAKIVVKQLSKEASILNIGIQTEVPEKGRDILNQLVIEYNKKNVEDKNKVIDNTINFIDDRVRLLTSELGQVEKGLEDFRQKNNVIDIPAQSNLEFSSLRKLNESIVEKEVSLKIIEMITDYLSNPSRRYSLVPSTLSIQDLTLAKLIGEFNTLQLEREARLKTVPAANPGIIVLEGQLEKLRTSILENLKNVTKAIDEQKLQMVAEFNQIKSRLATIPFKERELLEISRQQGIKEKLFLFLLQKREESAITRASAVSNAESIDPATTGILPVSPKRQQTYIIAILIGLLLPVIIIYIRDVLNDKVTVREDIIRHTQTPLVGEVSHHQDQTRTFVVGKKDRDIISEQFRIIRTNLQFLTNNKTSPVLMLTSSVSGEGKTFCSMNIAAVWALAGKKTVVLELDLRKPKISKSLGIDRDRGITNYVLGQIKKEEIAIPIPGMDNLYMIPAGPIPPNPSEILMDPKMDELFAYLRTAFDFIVIDTAPVGLVSDARILGRFADASIYVIRQRYTIKKQLANIQEIYSKKLLPNLGILVNDVKIKGVNSYYGYGRTYGYGYGGYGSNYHYHYAYGYGTEKKSFFRTLLDKIKGK